MSRVNDVWVAIRDPKTGRTYYANSETRETRWDLPHAEKYVDGPNKLNPNVQHKHLNNINSNNRKNEQKSSDYNYNHKIKSKHNQNNGDNLTPIMNPMTPIMTPMTPMTPITPIVASPLIPLESIGESKWKAVIDPKSRHTYYFHQDTKETCWTLPPNMTRQVKFKFKCCCQCVHFLSSPQTLQTHVTSRDKDRGIRKTNK